VCYNPFDVGAHCWLTATEYDEDTRQVAKLRVLCNLVENREGLLRGGLPGDFVRCLLGKHGGYTTVSASEVAIARYVIDNAERIFTSHF
jgi:hypothetical protein